MEYEKAISVLKNLLEKHVLSAEEQEAVLKSIAMLSLAAQASASQVKKIKEKRDKATEWD